MKNSDSLKSLNKALQKISADAKEICDRWFLITDATSADHVVEGKITGLSIEEGGSIKLFSSVSQIRGFKFKHIERDSTGNWWVVKGGRRKRVLFEWI